MGRIITKKPHKPHHMSASTISSYLWCPVQYYGEKVLRLDRKPSLDMERGTAVHKGIEAYHLGQDPFEAFYKQWKEGAKKLRAAGIEFDEDQVNAALLMLTLYERNPSPPGKTEVEFNHTFAATKGTPLEGMFFKGYFDLLTDTIVYDHKTSSKPWEKSKAKKEYQAKLYPASFKEQFGHLPEATVFNVMTVEPKPQLIRHEVKASEELVTEALDVATEVLCKMQEGTWIPKCYGPCKFPKLCGRE